jgi:hypothetical protein
MLSIMPLFAVTAKAKAEVMNSPHPLAQRTIITGGPLAMRPSRVADRLAARVLGASLDRELAAGRAPEASPLLAARAQRVVAIRHRRELARNWENLLRIARRRAGTYHPALPVSSDRLVAAEPAVRELVRCLTTPLPVAARGAALATALLTDALGPVYNPRSRVTLDEALAAAIAQLDPALPLMTEVP